jgi:hypothetical protein
LDHQLVSESIARQLAGVWATHRTPAFVEYLRQAFGCEPRQPVRFAGIFSLQMIGGYFFPDLPAGPGPVVEQLWLTDDTGFRASSMRELCATDNLESDNPLVVYDPARRSLEPIGSQPCLHVHPRFMFLVRGDGLIYREMFGFSAGCTKVALLGGSDRVQIRETRITNKLWQGRFVVMEHAEPSAVAGAIRDSARR